MATIERATVGERTVVYTLRRQRGYRKITLSVRRDGRVLVTVGKTVSRSHIERFFQEKFEWLRAVLSTLPVPVPHDPIAERHAYLRDKEAARTRVQSELTRLNVHYGFRYGRVSIRATSSRWGSCSSKKNLNFSYKILHLPSHLQEYIIVHELCHLREMNHKPAFWALVAQVVPDYRTRRAELRTHRLT